MGNFMDSYMYEEGVSTTGNPSDLPNHRKTSFFYKIDLKIAQKLPRNCPKIAEGKFFKFSNYSRSQKIGFM